MIGGSCSRWSLRNEHKNCQLKKLRHETIPRIPIDTNNRFAYSDRGSYQLHVQYECLKCDPNWIGRLRADAEVEGGGIVPILGETDDFEMGHHNDSKIRGV